MPHLDNSQLVTRAMAAELARESRRNAERIREQIEDGTAGVVGRRAKSIHCGVCGSPFGDRTKPRNACDECARNLPKGKMETNTKEVI